MPKEDTLTLGMNTINIGGTNVSITDNITITTASKEGNSTYRYTGSGTTATITRGIGNDSFDTVPMITQTAGTLTLSSPDVTNGNGENKAPTGIKLDGGNRNTSADGSIVNVTGGTLNITEGTTLENANTSGKGGAVYVDTDGEVNMTGGAITGNTATDGGSAVYVNASSTSGGDGGRFSMTGGSITGNTGAINVGGTNANLTFSGSPTIYNNTDASGNQKNVVLDQDSISVINAGSGSDKLNTDAHIGVYVSDDPITGKTTTVFDEHGKTGKDFGSCLILGDMNLPFNRKMTTANGGAIHVVSGTTVSLKDTKISDFVTTGDGAGIYLEEGSTLKLSGKADFGSGNFKDETLNDKTNGGQTYEKPRQDIFIAGYQGTVGGAGSDKDDPKMATSIVVSGPLVSGYDTNGEPLKDGDGNIIPASIWVWAEEPVQQTGESVADFELRKENNHYEQLKQFAVLDDSLLKDGTNGEKIIDPDKLTDAQLSAIYKSFRNAQDDETANNSTGEPLTGAEGPNGESPKYIFWTGISGTRKVILRKISDDNVSLYGAEFVLYKGGSTKPFVLTDRNKQKWQLGNDGTLAAGATLVELKSGQSGVFWIGELPYGTYYLKETASPYGTTDAVNTGKWFCLIVDAEGTWMSGAGYKDADAYSSDPNKKGKEAALTDATAVRQAVVGP